MRFFQDLWKIAVFVMPMFVVALVGVSSGVMNGLEQAVDDGNNAEVTLTYEQAVEITSYMKSCPKQLCNAVIRTAKDGVAVVRVYPTSGVLMQVAPIYVDRAGKRIKM